MKITVSMFEKGRSFLMAGGLVKAYEGHRFVYLHLLGQGLECIAKAVLLEKDYEKYKPKLKNYFGHDLEKIIDEVTDVFNAEIFSVDANAELNQLNAYYKRHMLRYGNSSDFKLEAVLLVVDHLHIELLAWVDELNDQFSRKL